MFNLNWIQKTRGIVSELMNSPWVQISNKWIVTHKLNDLLCQDNLTFKSRKKKNVQVKICRYYEYLSLYQISQAQFITVRYLLPSRKINIYFRWLCCYSKPCKKGLLKIFKSMSCGLWQYVVGVTKQKTRTRNVTAMKASNVVEEMH